MLSAMLATLLTAFYSAPGSAGIAEERVIIERLRSEYALKENEITELRRDIDYYQYKSEESSRDIELSQDKLLAAKSEFYKATLNNRNNPNADSDARLKKAKFVLSLSERALRIREKKAERYHQKEYELKAELKARETALANLSQQINRRQRIMDVEINETKQAAVAVTQSAKLEPDNSVIEQPSTDQATNAATPGDQSALVGSDSPESGVLAGGDIDGVLESSALKSGTLISPMTNEVQDQQVLLGKPQFITAEVNSDIESEAVLNKTEPDKDKGTILDKIAKSDSVEPALRERLAKLSSYHQEMYQVAAKENARLNQLLSAQDLGKPPYKSDVALLGSHLPEVDSDRVFEFIGKNTYRYEAPLTAGTQDFTVAGVSWEKDIPLEDDGAIYVFILDAAQPDNPRLTLYKKSLLPLP